MYLLIDRLSFSLRGDVRLWPSLLGCLKFNESIPQISEPYNAMGFISLLKNQG